MFTASAFVIDILSNISRKMMPTKPLVLFVLGGPGAGKGTQCANLVRDYNFIHLSAGQLLRDERNSGSKDGSLINTYIKEGKIVPVEITVRLLEKEMNNNPNGRFLVDGFPRNENNLQGWKKHMEEKVDCKGVLFFDCPEDVCVKRILKRGETSGRVDDNEESLRKRFQTFHNETMPVVEYFKERNLVMSVNAIPEPDEVYENVKLVMGSM